MFKNLTEYFSARAISSPNSIAVCDLESCITFSELVSYAKKIAHMIHSHTTKNNQPIVVHMKKSVVSYTVLIGVLYSGNYYVPVDIKMPDERLKKIIARIGNPLIISDGTYPLSEELVNLDDDTIIIDRLEHIDDNSIEGGELGYKSIIDVDPAYMLFTSGSTGMPKGVIISHRAVIDYIEWQCSTLLFDSETVLASQAPFYFDASVPDIYSVGCVGATLYLIPDTFFLQPGKLVEYLNDKGVNTIIWVPSALIRLADSGIFDKAKIEELRLAMFCGEVMPCKQLNKWISKHPDAVYVNLYGPTEATYACSYYIIDKDFNDDESLPLGKACENTQLLVIDQDGKEIREGKGELCIRGTCLALGYYSDIEKTSDSFVDYPNAIGYMEKMYKTGDIVEKDSNGNLMYIGRKDNQIKHRGYRIELGEIESAGYSIEFIRRGIALYDDFNKKIIYCCEVAEDHSEKDVYASMKPKIPMYMMPDRIVIMEELPLNANGKIDRVRIKHYLIEN